MIFIVQKRILCIILWWTNSAVSFPCIEMSLTAWRCCQMVYREHYTQFQWDRMYFRQMYHSYCLIEQRTIWNIEWFPLTCSTQFLYNMDWNIEGLFIPNFYEDLCILNVSPTLWEIQKVRSSLLNRYWADMLPMFCVLVLCCHCIDTIKQLRDLLSILNNITMHDSSKQVWPYIVFSI